MTEISSASNSSSSVHLSSAHHGHHPDDAHLIEFVWKLLIVLGALVGLFVLGCAINRALLAA